MALINYRGNPLSGPDSQGVGGSAGSQFRRQASAYGQALRILTRAARRGDANAALKAIAVREDAMNKGYSPGGVSRKSETDAGILSMMNAKEASMQDKARAADIERQRAELEMQGLGQGQGQAQPAPARTVAPGFVDNPRRGLVSRLEGATGVEGARGLSPAGEVDPMKPSTAVNPTITEPAVKKPPSVKLKNKLVPGSWGASLAFENVTGFKPAWDR